MNILVLFVGACGSVLTEIDDTDIRLAKMTQEQDSVHRFEQTILDLCSAGF